MILCPELMPAHTSRLLWHDEESEFPAASRSVFAAFRLRFAFEGPAANRRTNRYKNEERMTETIHPVASGHLPSFITGPGETDVLMIAMSVILVLFVLMVGVLYFRLHALPERFAHKKVQFEIVCVLALIAMFTHAHFLDSRSATCND